MLICFCVILLYFVVLLKYFDNLLFVMFIKRFNDDDVLKNLANNNLNTNKNENDIKNLTSEQQRLNKFFQMPLTRLNVTQASALTIKSGPLTNTSFSNQLSTKEFRNSQVKAFTQTNTTIPLQQEDQRTHMG